MKALLVVVAALWPLLATLPSRAAGEKPADQNTTKPDDVDWEKARSLRQREQRGEKLTADEQVYLDHAKELRRKMQGGGGAGGQDGRPKVDPPRESTGLIPLTQMNGDTTYKGIDGGLYGHGSNDPPEKLMQAARAAAIKVEPLDADGKLSAS